MNVLEQTSGQTHAAAPALRWLAWTALAAATAFALLLGVRRLDNEDLGYHLGFGEHFLQTGRLMDSSPFLYTLHGEHYEPGPGEHYDSSGTFRFVSANWLTQIVMAWVYARAGADGLCVLQAGLVAVVFAFVLLTLRRLGAGALWSAGAVLLMALAFNPRLDLRPELFTYALLAPMIYLLTPRRDGLRVTGPGVAALCLLELALVNVHSYFLLGLFLTGLVWAGELLNLLLGRRDGERRQDKMPAAREGGTHTGRLPSPRTADAPREKLAVHRRNFRLLSIALVAEIAVCFVNPWGWRLAALPFQTLLYFHEQNITHPVPGAVQHPLSVVQEFFPPFSEGTLITRSLHAYEVLLAAAAAGLLVCLWRRRWAAVGWIAIMVAISLTMRRNIASAALVIAPVAAACLAELAARLPARLTRPLRVPASACAAILLLAASTWYMVGVFNHTFYTSELRSSRFGLGLTGLKVPLSACEWINRNRPAGHVWCDFESSSNVWFFTHPHRDVPILTNSWAFPPGVLSLVLEVENGRRDYRKVFPEYDVEVVVLRMNPSSVTLGQELLLDKEWALADLDAYHTLFVRRTGPNASRAEAFAIDPQKYDWAAYQERVAAIDVSRFHALLHAGSTLNKLASAEPDLERLTDYRSALATPMAWDTAAILQLEAALRESPRSTHAMAELGLALWRRASRRMLCGLDGGEQDRQHAIQVLETALALRPGDEAAQTVLRGIRLQIQQERSGSPSHPPRVEWPKWMRPIESMPHFQ